MIEARVLAELDAFVGELGTTPLRGRVALDDTLDRDLGIGSLERVELLARLEQAFAIRLPDAVLEEADTVRGLVSAVRAGTRPAAAAAVEPARPIAAGVPAPDSARTLVEVLRWHAERDPARVHVVLRLDDDSEQSITYGQLWERAGGVAAGLRARGVPPGASVALMLRTEPDFFAAFFGVLRAGAVPVPVYPPARPGRLAEYAARQVKILDNAQARLLLTFPEVERVADLLRPRVASLAEVTTLARLAPGRPGPPPEVGPEDPALIQYTSGSTGDPKGVLLTHGNLLANIRALGVALAVRADDVCVSWLPLYHDMGLIGLWLGSLYHGLPAVIMPPLAFLARPARWLRALAAHRGTISAAPNFAFDLCVKRVTDDELRGLDLGRWRLAMNGSEAVSADTLERFARRFAPCGFRAEALCPVYGLAESSVGLTLSRPGAGARLDRVRRDAFERARRAEPAGPEAAAPLTFVSSGAPLPGHDVRVVDAAGLELPERREGRVVFRGPSVTAGYFRNPAATAAVLHDGWMDSGDLGYRAGGELFVTGRSKDVIIKAGRNLYPQEVEELVGDVPGVRKGCVAVFGVGDAAIGTERLVVVAETRAATSAARAALEAAVRERVVDALDLPPDTIVMAPPGSVLKTSSGKIRRAATREAWLAGDLGRQASARRQWLRLVVDSLRARSARALALAGRLAFAAWLGALLAATGPALWLLVLALPGRAVDRVARAWCRLMLALAGLRPSVLGVERIPAGPVVLAANHSSYLDAAVLLAAIPRDFRFVGKRELGGWPLVGAIMRRAGHLAVERADPVRSVEDAARVSAAIRHGVSLAFFPEGTFLDTPRLLPFRLGAFKAAVESGAPVVPVAIRGTRTVLPAGAWLPRHARLGVVVGTPIVPGGTDWREMLRLRDAARAQIARDAA